MTSSSVKPTRSISLPSRLSPSAEAIEARLVKLKTNWENPRGRCLGMEDIQTCLSDLVHLFKSAQQLFRSRSLLPSASRKTVDEAIDGSVAILDACATARDLLLRTKDEARVLCSSLRRKDYSSVERAANSYVSFRKSAKKEIAKSLRALKATQRSHEVEALPCVHEDQALNVAIAVTRESSSVAVSILRCLFTLLSEASSKAKASGWGLVSKLVLIGSPEKEDGIFNEFGSVDSSVGFLVGQMRKRNGKNVVAGVERAKRRLEAVEGLVDGVENGLESLFRCLIQHRVSLLNLLTSS